MSLLGLVAIGASALLALPSEPAEAKRLVGTKGADRLVGGAKHDRIEGRAGNDRINGRGGGDRLAGSSGNDRLEGAGGRDRLSGGRGADRLNAADGKRDRAVRGGPGTDTCTIDGADLALVKGCEKVKVASGGAYGEGPGGGGGTGGGGAGGGGAGANCVAPPEEARLLSSAPAPREADEDAPPTFSEAFYATTITLDASADGLAAGQLPISIEEVCDVPANLAAEAAQLIGGDGVAIVDASTSVYQAGVRLQGQAATTAVAGADTALIRARLMRPETWSQDEDGTPVPTFRAIRIDITD